MANAALESLKNHAANPAQATIARGTGGAGQVSVTVFSLHCCTNDLPVVLDEHVCNVLHF